nr:hypothetical protein P5645_05735 [Bacillus subtilis]
MLARKWGDLGDRYGHRRILIGLLLAASFFFIPQALASSLSVLLVFRFLFGMAMGGFFAMHYGGDPRSGSRRAFKVKFSATMSAFAF